LDWWDQRFSSERFAFLEVSGDVVDEHIEVRELMGLVAERSDMAGDAGFLGGGHRGRAPAGGLSIEKMGVKHLGCLKCLCSQFQNARRDVACFLPSERFLTGTQKADSCLRQARLPSE